MSEKQGSEKDSRREDGRGGKSTGNADRGDRKFMPRDDCATNAEQRPPRERSEKSDKTGDTGPKMKQESGDKEG